MAGTHFQNKFTPGNTPSQQAADILQAKFPSKAGDTAQVVFHTTTPITAANEAAINHVVDRLRPLRTSRALRDRLARAPTRSSARLGNIAFALVQFDHRRRPTCPAAPSRRHHTAEAAAAAGFQVELGGEPDLVGGGTAAPGAERGHRHHGRILIMLLAFGSVVAMGLPMITALFGLASASRCWNCSRTS